MMAICIAICIIANRIKGHSTAVAECVLKQNR
jgi:hypothetical protein